MKFGEIVRFEIEQHFRRPTTWLYFVTLAVLTLLLNFGLAEGPRSVNSPLTVASTSALIGLAGFIVTAALFADAGTRDIQSGMHPILYTEPLSKIEYLGGRFVGATIVNALIFLAIPIGELAALKIPPIEAPETYLPFTIATYLEPFVLLTMPNLLVTGAILFTVAALTRRALPAYLIALGMGLGYVIAIELASLSRFASIAPLIDPFGVLSIQQHVRLWTPAEKNVWGVGFPPGLLLNRATWLIGGLAIFVLLYSRFRLGLPASGRWRWLKKRVTLSDSEGIAARSSESNSFADFTLRSKATNGLRMTRTRPSALEQTMAIARLALADTLKSKLFLGVLIATIAAVFVLGMEAGVASFETAIWPVTHVIARLMLDVPVSNVFILLIIIYAGELIWRDRDLRMDMIAGTAPVPEGVSLAGNFLALVAMLVVLQAAMMASGIVIQAVQGYTRFELLLYVKILFGFGLSTYIVFAVMAMAVHVVVDNKYLGHAIAAGFYATTLFAGGLRLRHHLLIFGSDPGWVYSDLNGFGPFTTPFVWFKMYWGAWALLFAVIGSLFWVRGNDRGLKHRLAIARSRLNGRALQVALAAVVLIGGFGGFIFYNTNVLNAYTPTGEAEARLAEYEKLYKRFENAPQPQLVANDLRVEIHPAKRSVVIDGKYLLVNRTGAPIDSLHFVLPRTADIRSMNPDRPARMVVDDVPRRYRIYALDAPLAPGDSMRVAFTSAFAPRGFPNDGINTSVATNGAYFSRSWMPYIGYQPSLEMTSTRLRDEHGLGPAARTPAATDTAALRSRTTLMNEDFVTTDAVMGTDPDQIAITAGTLIRQWEENGRKYFHYRTETPLPNGTPFLSGRYSVREDKWNAVALKIYYHPTHTPNLDRLMASMKASLDYFTTNFGPYPFKELRIIEFPRYASFARAHPFTIAYSEGGAFLTKVESWDVDRPFFVTAHETAHQWWGNQVTGARVAGAALGSETLAQYGSMMVMEKTYGVEHVRRFYDFAMKYYLQDRGDGGAPEVPLIDVDGQSYLYYHKGAVAMYTLREHIGETAVNTALKRFLDKYRDAGPPYPTSRDLYAQLQAVTPDSLRYLLVDLFEHITLTEVATDSASAERLPDGQYRVTMHVSANKQRVDSAGKETATAMNDLVEVVVYAPLAADESTPKVLYERRHRVKSGKQTIVLTVPSQPHEAAVDPALKLIQRMPRDNRSEVTTRTP